MNFTPFWAAHVLLLQRPLELVAAGCSIVTLFGFLLLVETNSYGRFFAHIVKYCGIIICFQSCEPVMRVWRCCRCCSRGSELEIFGLAFSYSKCFSWRETSLSVA
jgi:hypothetical protein